MKNFIIFLLLVPLNARSQDLLLQAIYGNWNNSGKYENGDRVISEKEQALNYSEDSDAEIYHWELGTPDNIPETVIIYTQNGSCGCY